MTAGKSVQVGEVIHGFARGAFGRDSYSCRRVEARGVDWIVTRNGIGEVEFTTYLDFETKDAHDDYHFGEGCDI